METENDLLKTHHILILGALKKCHVSTYHPMFEDYLQIARWVVIETHRTFLKENKSFDAFNNYVYQRVCWKITDELRKECAYTDKQQLEEEETSYLELADPHQEDLLEIKDILDKLQRVLTDQEKLFLEEAYFNELSMSGIARKHHVSRKTVYQWRKRVALKSSSFFD